MRSRADAERTHTHTRAKVERREYMEGWWSRMNRVRRLVVARELVVVRFVEDLLATTFQSRPVLNPFSSRHEIVRLNERSA